MAVLRARVCLSHLTDEEVGLMAVPHSPEEQGVAYRRGRMDARVEYLETAIIRIEASNERTIAQLRGLIEGIRADIANRDIQLAGYFKLGGVLGVLCVIIAPFVLRWIFGIK